MDATIKDLLSKLGIEAGKQAIQAVIRQWEERKQRKIDTAKKKEIAEVAASMIQGATMDDVREFSPTYRAIKHVVAKKAAKKVAAPARKKLVHHKSARKSVVVKKAALKRPTTRKR